MGGTGGGPGGVKPAEKSTLAKGPGGMGELKTPKKTGKGYDDLTPKEREKILQSKTEGFPPGFEDVLADYYRRLAKADGAAAEPAAEKPAGRQAGCRSRFEVISDPACELCAPDEDRTRLSGEPGLFCQASICCGTGFQPVLRRC